MAVDKKTKAEPFSPARNEQSHFCPGHTVGRLSFEAKTASVDTRYLSGSSTSCQARPSRDAGDIPRPQCRHVKA